jgi:L-lactate dehydrogenase complex protein LldE
VDQLAPRVAQATLEVLERCGCQVHYDPRQSCCGQALLNLGARHEAAALARRWVDCFAGEDAIVAPSASCVATVRRQYEVLGVAADGLAERTYELSEFLVRVLGREVPGAIFPHRVALLESCHGLRELGLGWPSEAAGAASQPGPGERLLGAVQGLELLRPERDECCGFGGAFSVKFPETSARIGRARLAALARSGAEYVTGSDVSCLLHLDGLRRREGFGPEALHLAEILATGGSR